MGELRVHTRAYSRLPLRTRLAQVVGEGVGRAAAVQAEDGVYFLVGQLPAGVHGGDARVVPARQLAEVDIGDEFARQPQVVHALKVVGYLHRADAHRHYKSLCGQAVELLAGGRHVDADEVGLQVAQALQPLAGADASVGDGHAVPLPVRLERLVVERQGEGGPCGGHHRAAACRNLVFRLAGGRHRRGQQDERHAQRADCSRRKRSARLAENVSESHNRKFLICCYWVFMFPFPCPFPPSGVVVGSARHGLQPCGIGAGRHVCHAVASSCHRVGPVLLPLAVLVSQSFQGKEKAPPTLCAVVACRRRGLGYSVGFSHPSPRISV